MNRINYSIIIPHKNIPDLLQRCLNSIPRREDIQIIVVDDNSDTNKVDFNNFPGIGEQCVEIYFTKEGRGAGYARNVGLKYAKGKWLLFADADDFFNSILLEKLDSYCSSICDIIYFGINSVNSDDLKMASRGHFVNNYIKKDIKNGSNFELSRFKRYAPWSKMIRRELVDKHCIRFEERYVSNDIWFSVLTGFYAQNVTADLSPIYCLTFRPGSLEMTISKKNIDERYDAACKVNAFFIKNGLVKHRMNLWFYSFYYLHFNLKAYIFFIKSIYEFYKGNNVILLCFVDLFITFKKGLVNRLKRACKIHEGVI